jgi:hypothetical protein
MKQGDRMGQEAQQNASKQFKPGRAGFDPKQALEQMKQKFGRGKSRGSQLGKGGGQGQGESEGDASIGQLRDTPFLEQRHATIGANTFWSGGDQGFWLVTHTNSLTHPRRAALRAAEIAIGVYRSVRNRLN